jgi:membrane protein YdbS with pleckstrin-like domain
MHTLPAIFALLVAAIGWYYLFYSKAASRLSSIEEEKSNRLRGLLRRINAILMLVMAVGIALAMYKFNRDETYEQFLITWMAILLLLVVVMVLGLIDVRLTWKLRRTLRDRNRPT